MAQSTQFVQVLLLFITDFFTYKRFPLATVTRGTTLIKGFLWALYLAH